EGATWEYSTDGGETWTEGEGDSFVLEEGEYEDVQVRQTDAAGNASEATSLGPVTVDVTIDAVDDVATLDMGEMSRTVGEPETNSNVGVLGLAEAEVADDNSVAITVSEDTGDLQIEVSQTALVGVADAFRLEVIDAEGNVVYAAVTENSLVGDVAG